MTVWNRGIGYLLTYANVEIVTGAAEPNAQGCAFVHPIFVQHSKENDDFAHPKFGPQ